MRIARAASSFSILLSAVLALGADYGLLHERLSGAPSDEAAIRVLTSLDEPPDQELRSAIRVALDNPKAPQIKRVREMVELRAAASRGNSNSDAKDAAQRIKASPLYRDVGEKDQANWLAGAFERIKNLLNRRPRDPNLPDVRLGGLEWLVWVMWGVLAAGLLVFAYFAFRYFAFRSALRRKARALLEEDEPERSLDEWLEQADLLASEGRFREAVRALYLACLLRFDEHGVARFSRHETNWEHLGRIRSSPKFPPGLDFLSPTKEFDGIWYGMRTATEADVSRFRDWYRGLGDALRRVA